MVTVVKHILAKLVDEDTRTQESSKTLDTRNTLATHIIEHCIEWEKSSIKEYESNWYRRKVKEGIWIKMTEQLEHRPWAHHQCHMEYYAV